MKTRLLILSALFALSAFQFGCATATRVTLRDGDKSATLVLPKNYRANELDLALKPSGEFTLKAKSIEANASKVIDSTAGAAGVIGSLVK